MISNLIKLVIALWIAKHWILDNELVDSITNKIKNELKKNPIN